MPTEPSSGRRRRRVLVPLALLAAVPLVACAGQPAPATTLPVVVSDGSPNGDAIAVPRGVDAAVQAAIKQLPELITGVLDGSGVPGMAVAVVAGGETVFAEGYGVKEAGGTDPIDAGTVFQIASLSKSLTGTILAKAVSDGVIDWSTPISALLPDLALADPYVTAHATIADYMSHRSGLFTGAGDDLEMLGYDRATILQRLRLLPLAPFRSSYNYSNFGITIAGEATAEAAGTSWEELAEHTLFGPLGMTSTSARHADYLARPDRAPINALMGGAFAPRFDRDPDAESPAGGVSSKVVDLAEWMKLVLAGGEWHGEPFIAEDALLPAISGQVASAWPSALGERGGQYGYGFNVGTALDGEPIVSHSGAFILGTGTNYRMLPGLGVGIVALTNGSPVGAAEAVVSDFTDLVLYGHLTRDWPTAYAAAFQHYFVPEGDLVGVARPEHPADPQELDAYSGVYRNPYFGDLVVAPAGDGLEARLGPDGSFALRLDPWDGDEFAFDILGEEAPDGSRSSASFAVNDGVASSVRLDYFDRWGLGTWTRSGE